MICIIVCQIDNTIVVVNMMSGHPICENLTLKLGCGRNNECSFMLGHCWTARSVEDRPKICSCLRWTQVCYFKIVKFIVTQSQSHTPKEIDAYLGNPAQSSPSQWVSEPKCTTNAKTKNRSSALCLLNYITKGRSVLADGSQNVIIFWRILIPTLGVISNQEVDHMTLQQCM